MPTASLPARASVEFLRKQAKHLHKAFGDGDVDAMARIREHLPRAGKLPDDQVPSMDLSLQEAQHALACEYGFGKWEELMAAAKGPGFDDLAHLTDQEAQRVLRDVDQRDFVRGLVGAPRPVLDRFLGNMSTRVRGFITTEMAFVQDLPAEEVDEARLRMLERVVGLAERDQLEWPPQPGEPATGERELTVPDDSRFAHIDRPVADNSDNELVGVIQALAEQARREGILSLGALAKEPGTSLVKQGILLVVDGTEPDLVTDMLEERAATILRNRRIRGRICIEAWMSIQAGDNPRIVRTKVEMHFLEAYSEISASRGR